MQEQQGAVSATLMELADTLVSDYDLFDYLDLLLERSTAVLGAAAGGVMLTVHGELHLLASTDEPTRLVELFELQRQDGPCVDCHRHGQPVVVEDLAAVPRWPQFTPRALEAGYRSAFAFPLRLHDERIGVLNLFGDRPGSVARELRQAAQAFAHMAAIGIVHERAVRNARELAAQLQGALSSRVVLEQAKGMVAERAGCDVGRAFELLRWYARRRNRKLRLVAQAVVAGDLPLDAVAGSEPRPPGS